MSTLPYADDTQIFFAGNDAAEFEKAIISDLERIDKWFEDNEMKRNHWKFKAMVMGNTQADLVFSCDNTVIPIEKAVELLGVTVDSKMKFKGHLAKICRKVSQQVAVLKRMRKMLPFEFRLRLYQDSLFLISITVPSLGTFVVND